MPSTTPSSSPARRSKRQPASDSILDSENIHRRDNLNHPVLDECRERELTLRARQGDSEAVRQLVIHNQKLVAMIANRYRRAGLVGDNSLMDLIQYGNEGLLEAIQRYDPGRGWRFSTYATWWIRAYVRRFGMTSGKTISPTARQADLLVMIRRSRARLTQALHRDPDPAEIAGDARLSEALVIEYMPLLESVASLDQEAYQGDGPPFHELIPSDMDVEDEIDGQMLKEQLYQALESLSPRERRVIALRYGLGEDEPEPLTLTEVGKLLGGYSREYVRQMEANALIKLRVKLLARPSVTPSPTLLIGGQNGNDENQD